MCDHCIERTEHSSRKNVIIVVNTQNTPVEKIEKKQKTEKN